MPPSRLIGLLRAPALTAAVLAGLFAPAGSVSGVAPQPVADEPPSLASAATTPEDRPFEAEVVTAAAALPVTIVPEKVRLRFGARAGCSAVTADAEAARTPATQAPLPGPRLGALPTLRLAERAGRCSSPPTAPPSPSV